MKQEIQVTITLEVDARLKKEDVEFALRETLFFEDQVIAVNSIVIKEESEIYQTEEQPTYIPTGKLSLGDCQEPNRAFFYAEKAAENIIKMACNIRTPYDKKRRLVAQQIIAFEANSKNK
jgi:hypothetical protein